MACSGYFLLCHSLLLLVLLLHGFITYANATKAQRGAKCFGNLLSYCRACLPVCGCACVRVWVRVCVHFRWVLALLYLHAVCHIRWQRFLAFSLSAKYFPVKQKKAPAVAATAAAAAAAEAVAAENHICRACLFGRDTRARVTRVICAA